MSGCNQAWYSFKSSMVEHLGCSSVRSGGQEHYNAKQFVLKEKQFQKRNMDMNTTLVAAAIQVCKMKAAGSSYERLVGFLSLCGSDVGNIGHGR